MKGHTILLGGIGGDSHSVGLTILRQSLSAHGYQVRYLGTQNTASDFFRVAGMANLVMISSTELDELIRQGKIVAGSRVDLAKSGIGIAVRAGAPRPDVGSSAALKQALLAAKTVGYTSGPSGVYMAGLIEKMGIAAEVTPKHRGVPSGGTIGTIVANGGAEIGFQQVSELVHIAGIDYIGPLPPEIQCVTVFSCGLQSGTSQPDAAKALMTFLTTPAAKNVMTKHGLDTV